MEENGHLHRITGERIMKYYISGTPLLSVETLQASYCHEDCNRKEHSEDLTRQRRNFKTD